MADGIDNERLVQMYDRVKRLEEERAGIAQDVKDIFAEMKSAGFEVKHVKRCLALEKIDAEKRQMDAAELQVYMDALGIS